MCACRCADGYGCARRSSPGRFDEIFVMCATDPATKIASLGRSAFLVFSGLPSAFTVDFSNATVCSYSCMLVGVER
eukprot:6209936-Pleurochrysis_carterae.AAC.1